MARRFRMIDYEKSLDQTITIREVLPPDHLARFIIRVILMLDVSAIYAKYSDEGGEAYAPELLLGLLFYGYATGGTARAWTYFKNDTQDWHLFNNGDRLTVNSGGFVGFNRSTPVTGSDIFAVQSPASTSGCAFSSRICPHATGRRSSARS